MFEVVTNVGGFDSTVYFIPLILMVIGIISIITRIGLFEAVGGIFCIVFAVLILSDPYVIVNTSYLSNGTLLVARTDFFMTPYLEIIYILFGCFLMILSYDDYKKSRNN